VTDQLSAAPATPAPQESFAPFGCPMGHGAPSGAGEGAQETGRARSGRRGKGYFIPGLIALAVMVAAGGVVNFAGLDHAHPSNLAGNDVATFVAQGIQAQQGLAAPPTISCPPREPVRTGLSFTCTWQQVGGDRQVKVTETDARGQYRFSVVN
jgi:Domain of unknown function (DUF4333)